MPRKSRLLEDIKAAVANGQLPEEFLPRELRSVFKNKYADGTYTTFPSKHRQGNKGGNSELFIRVNGRYKVLT